MPTEQGGSRLQKASAAWPPDLGPGLQQLSHVLSSNCHNLSLSRMTISVSLRQAGNHPNLNLPCKQGSGKLFEAAGQMPSFTVKSTHWHYRLTAAGPGQHSHQVCSSNCHSHYLRLRSVTI
jgi:hypothetical protein